MQTVARIRMPENGVFLCRASQTVDLMPGDACLVELDYGLDVGIILELFGVNENAADSERLPTFRVVRKITTSNDERMSENKALSEKAKKAFLLSVCREKGNVKILHVRFSYGRERLFIRYVAQLPVDLRRFIGQLQRDFKTHVDLWQVGVRDEAALIGCLGPCGRTVCCACWQRQFQPVNVRMARVQEMSLNPVSINGSCGRLKCCLRFEYQQYQDAGAHLPGNGSVVSCKEYENVEGVVLGRDVMRGRLTVKTRDDRFLTVSADSVSVIQAARNDDKGKENEREDLGGEWAES